MRTYFLQLTKPVIGATNWGASINQNWDKIDRGFGQINQNLLALQDKMTDIGTFSFIQVINGDNAVVTLDFALLTQFYCYDTGAEQWYKVDVEPDGNGQGWVGVLSTLSTSEASNYTSVKIGQLIIGSKPTDTNGQSGYFEHTDVDAYESTYYNNGSSEVTQLSSLSDYTAFLIALPNKWQGEDGEYEPSGAMQCYAFGELWTGSDIMIKTSIVQNNQRTTLIRRFKQSLGGYYIPTIDPAQPNCIIWSKASSSEAIAQYKTIIPHNLWAGVVNEIEVKKDNSGNLPSSVNTGQDSETTETIDSTNYTCKQNLADICFWRTNGSKRTRIYLDYWTAVKNGELWIYWESNVLNKDETYVITYIVTQLKQSAGG